MLGVSSRGGCGTWKGEGKSRVAKTMVLTILGWVENVLLVNSEFCDGGCGLHVLVWCAVRRS